MKKLISLLILIFAFSAVLVMTVNASMVPKLTTPSVTAYLDNGFYVGYCYNSTITAGETFDIEWKNDSSVTGYQVIVKSLDSDPNPGDSEPGTKLAEYNKSSGDNSVTLSSKITQNAAGKWLKVFVAYNYSDGYSSSASFYFIVSAVVDLETPELTVENIDSSNSLKLTWTKVSGATGYDIYRSTSSVASSFKTPIKSIASGSTTSWVDTGLEADTRYYYKIKAISGRYESDFSNRDYARTDEETVDFAVSKEQITFAQAGGSEIVTVTYSGSYSYDVLYGGISGATSEHDYKWLSVSKSGSKLTIKTNRPNYSSKDRIAEIEVYCSGQSRYIAVSQAACTESAPTTVAKTGANTSSLTTIESNSHFGTFQTPDDIFYLYVSTTNVRRIAVNLWKVGGSQAVRTIVPTITSTSGNVASYVPIKNEDGSALTAGEYYVDIWASNSDTANDFWSQQASKIRIYFTVKTASPSSGGASGESLEQSFESIASNYIIDGYEVYVLKAIKYHLEKSEKVISALESNNSAVFFFDGCSVNFSGGTVVANGYEKSGYKYNRSAVCIVVQKNNNSEYRVVFASEASTTADQVRSGTSIGRPITIDGIYEIFTVNHKGVSTPPYAALKVRDVNVIRCKTDVSSDILTYSDTGIHIHARQNKKITETSADSTGCILVGRQIYDKNKEFCDFIKNVTNFSKDAIYYQDERITNTFDSGDIGKNVGVMIMDRSCYVKSLPIIFGDDKESGGLEGDSIATGNDIAKEITRNSIDWRRIIMGSSDQCVEIWDQYDIIKIPSTPSSPIYKYIISYDANGGSGAPVSQTKNHNQTLTLSSTIPTRSGYTFKGWSTTAGGSVEYTAGDSYTADEGVTLYAVWEKSTISVTGVTIDKTSATLTVGDTLTLKATIAPSGATNKSVTWSSNNSTVASVSSGGVVTAKKAGTATITVKTADGNKSDVCTIKVNAKTISVTGVTIDKTSATLTVGDTLTLKATIAPSGATNKSVTWSSNNSTVASVSSGGVVTAKKAGTATITVKTADGNKSDVCTIKVVAGETTKIGDIDGSGTCNSMDIVLLAQYIANWNVDVQIANIDCNGDGNINTMDIVLLAQYVANWDVVLG